MDKIITFKEFKDLSIQDQVLIINDFLKDGETLTSIGSTRKINKAYIRDTFKANGYIYSNDRKAYIGTREDEAASKCMKEMDLADIEDRLQYLEASISSWRLEKDEAAAVVTPEKILINSEAFSGPIKTRSFKIYEAVLNDFIEFCNKNKNIRQQDLMTQALLEFMNKRG